MKTNILFVVFLLVALTALSQVAPVDNAGTAIGGYDVVSYFTVGKAVKGNQQHHVQIEGVQYYFSSKENQKLFESNPKKYIPQYDGYCALAISYGKKISIDPQIFKVTNDKLYLFYKGKAGNKEVNSIDTWIKNEPKLLKRADELWPDVKKKKFKEEDSL